MELGGKCVRQKQSTTEREKMQCRKRRQKKRSKQEGQTKVTKWKKKGVSRKQNSTTELKRVRQVVKNMTEGKKYECESKSLYGREEKIQEREKSSKVKRSKK